MPQPQESSKNGEGLTITRLPKGRMMSRMQFLAAMKIDPRQRISPDRWRDMDRLYGSYTNSYRNSQNRMNEATHRHLLRMREKMADVGMADPEGGDRIGAAVKLYRDALKLVEQEQKHGALDPVSGRGPFESSRAYRDLQGRMANLELDPEKAGNADPTQTPLWKEFTALTMGVVLKGASEMQGVPVHKLGNSVQLPQNMAAPSPRAAESAGATIGALPERQPLPLSGITLPGATAGPGPGTRISPELMGAMPGGGALPLPEQPELGAGLGMPGAATPGTAAPAVAGPRLRRRNPQTGEMIEYNPVTGKWELVAP